MFLPPFLPPTLLPLPKHSSLTYFIQFSSSSLPKPTWNSNSKLIISNPVLSIMESCNSMSHLKQIQAHMTRTGLITHRFPASRVLAFCALSENGDINHARLVFSQLAEPNVFIWNTLIRGYNKANLPNLGLSLFSQMSREEAEFDNRTFVFALKACEQFSSVSEGEEVHCQILKLGFDLDLLVRNGLMHFYGRSGLLGPAHRLFDGCLARDVVTWTTMIDAYAQKNLPDDALKLFYSMISDNVNPNEKIKSVYERLLQDLSIAPSPRAEDL